LFIWLVIGLVIYFTYSRYHSRLQTGGIAVPVGSGKAGD
jgi:hypothetical protein